MLNYTGEPFALTKVNVSGLAMVFVMGSFVTQSRKISVKKGK